MTDRIAIDPTICHGKPVIAGTRILVSNIFSELATGATPEQIMADYPSITQADISAALMFGSEMANLEYQVFGYEEAVS